MLKLSPRRAVQSRLVWFYPGTHFLSLADMRYYFTCALETMAIKWHYTRLS